MAIVRWEPFRDLSELNRLFTPAASQRRWLPAIDLAETTDQFVLTADLPGLGEDDVKIEVEDRVLSISGERKPRVRRDQGGLPPRRARLRLVPPHADAPRGRRRRGDHRLVRQGRARDHDPEARAAQAAPHRDRPAEDRRGDRGVASSGMRVRDRHGGGLGRPGFAAHGGVTSPRVHHPHPRSRLLRPHRHAEARPRRGPHAGVRAAGDQGGREDARGP